MPLSTPGGMPTETVRAIAARPLPRHCVQGWRRTVPVPPQLGQVETCVNDPKIVRCECCTSPRPPQVGHRSGADPRSAPVPKHRGQVSNRSISIVFSTPVAASSSDSSRSYRRSAPASGASRSTRLLRRPKNMSKMSLNGPNPPPATSSAGTGCTVPNRLYWARRSGSLRTW